MAPLALSEYEKPMAVIITVLTNAAILPFIHEAYKKHLAYEVFLGTVGFLVSVMYHTEEILDMQWFGMNDGNWHRMDNIFAIQGFTSLWVLFMNNTPKVDEFLRWTLMFLVIWFQERGPWHLENAVMPVVLAAAMCLGKYLYLGHPPRFLNQKPFWIGLGMLGAGLCCFIRGLDDKHDYLRICHSLWHGFVSIAGYFFWHRMDRHVGDGKDSRMTV